MFSAKVGWKFRQVHVLRKIKGRGGGGGEYNSYIVYTEEEIVGENYDGNFKFKFGYAEPQAVGTI